MRNAVERELVGLPIAEILKQLDGRCAYCGGVVERGIVYCWPCWQVKVRVTT